MTKAEIVTIVNEKLGRSRRDCAEIVEKVFDLIKENLENGTKVKISGFGNFVVRHKKSRIGRNPHTGEAIEISARNVLTFKASQILKEAIQNKSEK